MATTTHADPAWQTLKGVQAGDLIANSGNRKAIPLDSEFHAFQARDKWAITTEDGTVIRSGGVATKYWVRKVLQVAEVPEVQTPSVEGMTVVQTPPQRLEDDKDLDRLSKALTEPIGTDWESAALVAMRDGGASYAQIAQVLRVVPMTARSRYLALTR